MKFTPFTTQLLFLFFAFIIIESKAQSFIPITNYHCGISIGVEGTQGTDYVFDRYYYDPLVNDVGLCYIKSDVNITLAHNSYNSRAHEDEAVIVGGDFGTIRYKVDRDYQELFWAGDDGPKANPDYVVYPKYPGPISFDDMEYESGVPVVGTIGFKPGVPITDRKNAYSRGMLDEAGNEYHYFTYADDDDQDFTYKGYLLENAASDGKSMLFCVNPKTPAIWLRATNSSAEYYTTPAKINWVPNVFEQTSYVTDNVEINLKNIMNSNTVYYRIDGGSYQAYTGAINSNTLTNGEHILEFYYNSSYVQTRKIVKNPDHPSKQDVFEDGSGHGYILWRNQADFLRWKERLANGSWTGDYNVEKAKLGTFLSWTGNQGIRNPEMSRNRKAALLTVVPLVEGISGNEQYITAAKRFLLNNQRMHVEAVGFQVRHDLQPCPSKELNYRGYYDDWVSWEISIMYDLMAAYFRSDQVAGGMTPIEDYRLRDMLAILPHEALSYYGNQRYYKGTGISTTPDEAMWQTAHNNAACCAAMAMPSYNTEYLGTSGFDGTQASYSWTPYPDYPSSWKDVLYTYTDRSNPAHVAQLKGYPNHSAFFNWYDGTLEDGLIRADGSWADRPGYAATSLMGHGIEFFYNIMRRKMNKTYPKLDLFIKHSIAGTLECHKLKDDDVSPTQVSRNCMENEYFPDLAPLVEEYDAGPYCYYNNSYCFLFINPDWESVTLCSSPDAPTVPANLLGTAGESTASISWSASTHSSCSVTGYNIKRNGTIIATVQGTQYSDAYLTLGTQYEYSVASVSEAGVTSAYCTPIQLTTFSDNIPPTIVNIPNTDLSNTVFIEFSELMDETSVENISYYSINNGITISSAELQIGGKVVKLSVSTMTVGTTYTINVNNVKDSHANAIASNTTGVFICVAPSANLALNKPVTADSEYTTDYIAENAVDGVTNDNASRWISAGSDYPHWIEVDLLQPTTIDKVDFYTGHTSSDYLIYDYQIQYWNGSAWVDAVAITGNTLADVSHSFSPVNTQKVRLYCTAGQDNLVRLFEIEIYNNSGSAIVDVTGVSVSPPTLNLNVGQNSDLTETISPSNATNQNVTWSSGNTSVATVDANGLVTAVSAGTATITVTTNDGGFTANCVVTVASSVITNYYCDPVNGSMSNLGTQASPWASLEDVFVAGKTFNAGDVINLMSGYHGQATISGINLAPVTIQAASGQQPALKSIVVNNASNWIIKDITITPEAAPAYSANYLYIVESTANNIVLDNCELYSVDNVSAWTIDDWNTKVCHASKISGNYNTVKNCTIRNIKTGTFVYGDYNMFENNFIANFAEDGMRGLGDYNTFQYNTVQDNYNVNSNHDDGFQSYSVDENWNVGASTVYGNVLIGNVFIQSTDPNRPFQGDMQGIGNFDGMFEDWVVENNIVKCSMWHGITFLGAMNCKIVNNIVVDQDSNTSPMPWIQIAAHKDGTPSTGNLVRNNLCPRVNNDANVGVVDNNIIISFADYDNYFVDFDNQDFHYVSGSSAIDAGSSVDAPSIDIDGVARPQGSAYDVGAYEYISGGTVPVQSITVNPTSETLNVSGTIDLAESILPTTATDKSVVWSSSNTSIATVNSSGVVTAIAEGNCVITVTTNDGGHTADCNITVSNTTLINLALGKLVTVDSELSTDYVAENAVDGITDDNASRWISANTAYPHWIEIDLQQTANVERVDFCTGHTNADYIIYDYQIQYWNGSSWVDVVSVNGNTLADVTHSFSSVSTDKLRLYCTAGQDNIVRLFEIEAYGDAVTTIPVTSVSVSQTTLSITEGQTSTLSETVLPTDATDKSVIWSSSDISVVQVDANGLLTAISAGTAVVTVTTNDGGFTATSNITVNVPVINVENITVTPVTAILDIGQTVQLIQTIIPVNATDKSVIWSSANTSIATVNSSGLVSGMSDGTTTITVTTNDGGFTASCDVTVNNPAVLPSPWVNADIGAVAAAGSASYSNGVYTVSGSGANIWNSADEFQYVYQQISGDAVITAHITSLTNPHSWTKGGVMMRETLTANSKNGNVFLAPVTTNGSKFSYRSSTGGTSSEFDGPNITAPYWLRLERLGNTFTGSVSVDGSNWTTLGSTTIDMAVTYYVGLSVVSLVDGTLATATFDNVTVEQLFVNSEPTISAISNITVFDNAGPQTTNLTGISDGDGNTQTVSVTASSSNTNVVNNVSVNYTSGNTTGILNFEPVSAGTATITVIVSDDGGTQYGGTDTNTISFNVTVEPSVVNVINISVSPLTLTLYDGQTDDLTEIVTPTNATDKSVVWSSSNTSVATVSTTGLVTATGVGNATITVTTNDGGYTANCSVTVNSITIENLALGKPATADSEYNTSYPAENAVDGNNSSNSSRWISGGGAYPHWIEIDLQGACVVSEVKFWTGYYEYRYPIYDYQIQYWDGTNWIDIINVTGNTNAEVTHTFAAVTTDKIRLYATAGENDLVRLFEIEVWGYETALKGLNIGVLKQTECENTRLMIYPNPVLNNQFAVTLEGYKGDVLLQIYNITGAMIYSTDIKATTKIHTEIFNSMALNKGMYFIRVNDGEKSGQQKLIVK